jgi:hypothetical protein
MIKNPYYYIYYYGMKNHTFEDKSKLSVKLINNRYLIILKAYNYFNKRILISQRIIGGLNYGRK